jgi:hypothetical protein
MEGYSSLLARLHPSYFLNAELSGKLFSSHLEQIRIPLGVLRPSFLWVFDALPCRSEESPFLGLQEGRNKSTPWQSIHQLPLCQIARPYRSEPRGFYLSYIVYISLFHVILDSLPFLLLS